MIDLSIQFPGPTADLSARLDWASERYCDLLEGLISDETAWLICTVIHGWADVCSHSDRASYHAMAGHFADYLHNKADGLT